jgi:hypothetical protein
MVADSRVGRSVMTGAVVLGLVLAGCIHHGRPAADAAHDATTLLHPVSKKATLDITNVPSASQPRPAAACLILEVNNVTRISNLTWAVAWTPSGDGSRVLRAQVDVPGAADLSKDGASPLVLTAAAFDAARGDRVRLLIGFPATPSAPVPSQRVNAQVAFVQTVQPGDSDEQPRTLFSTETTCPA